MSVINQFQGDYRWLSNFWTCNIHYNNKIYPTSEHFYQAYKTVDRETHEMLRTCPTPFDVKKKSHSIEVREDWGKIKLKVMNLAVTLKFSQNPTLLTKLLLTDDIELIEGNTWKDIYWGVDLNTGKGENNLGKILMKVRSHLRLT